jgi:hypothetical protein
MTAFKCVLTCHAMMPAMIPILHRERDIAEYVHLSQPAVHRTKVGGDQEQGLDSQLT